MREGLRNVARRIVNAEDSFIAYAMEQHGFTRGQAEKILRVYRKVRAIKIDSVGGQFTFTHGNFAETDVMRRALALKETP